MPSEAVRAIARGIAADIRRNGHWQGGPGWQTQSYAPFGNPHGRCCIVLSPTAETAMVKSEDRSWRDFLEELPVERKGLVAEWNDGTPTEEVLATLDRIAMDES